MTRPHITGSTPVNWISEGFPLGARPGTDLWNGRRIPPTDGADAYLFVGTYAPSCIARDRWPLADKLIGPGWTWVYSHGPDGGERIGQEEWGKFRRYYQSLSGYYRNLA